VILVFLKAQSFKLRSIFLRFLELDIPSDRIFNS